MLICEFRCYVVRAQGCRTDTKVCNLNLLNQHDCILKKSLARRRRRHRKIASCKLDFLKYIFWSENSFPIQKMKKSSIFSRWSEPRAFLKCSYSDPTRTKMYNDTVCPNSVGRKCRVTLEKTSGTDSMLILARYLIRVC